VRSRWSEKARNRNRHRNRAWNGGRIDGTEEDREEKREERKGEGEERRRREEGANSPKKESTMPGRETLYITDSTISTLLASQRRLIVHVPASNAEQLLRVDDLICTGEEYKLSVARGIRARARAVHYYFPAG
jgi:hypothetical protein